MTMITDALTTRRTVRTAQTDVRRNLLRMPLLWLQRLFWRNELKALEPEQMRDCGLDPEIVRREAIKPFWRD